MRWGSPLFRRAPLFFNWIPLLLVSVRKKCPSRWLMRACWPEITRRVSGMTQSQLSARPMIPPACLKLLLVTRPGICCGALTTSNTNSMVVLLALRSSFGRGGVTQQAIVAVAEFVIGAEAGQPQRRGQRDPAGQAPMGRGYGCRYGRSAHNLLLFLGLFGAVQSAVM